MANSYGNVHSKILRSGQYIIEDTKFVVQAPRVFKKTKDQDVDESSKRIDDLRNEIKALENEIAAKLESSEKEASDIIARAESDAEKIVKEAEKNAFERVRKSLEEKETAVQSQQTDAEHIISEAKEQAEDILRKANDELNKAKEAARKEALETGRDQGYEEGKSEIVSMVERLKSIIAITIKERERILIHSERQIMGLVLTMVKKVVKKITQEDAKVVMNNTKEVLSIVRGAMMVYIHVNHDDFNFVTKHKDELIKMIEGMPEVKILEDPTVDRGGAYIETDIGEIDARISTQLEEIENKIKFYVPIKVQGKMADKKDEDYIPQDEVKEDLLEENESLREK